jgi:nucleoid DNA-binding protein/cell division septation protein DedD
MDLGKYVHALLLENETVIVPGFGAFLSNYKPAGINEETHVITPPSKEIIFSQKIRNNDGLLVGYIAENEDISHFDALKKIEREREEILYKLDKGEKVTLENTGILYYNENQEVVFEAFQKDNLLLDSFGLETTLLAPPEEEEEVAAEDEMAEQGRAEEISGKIHPENDTPGVSFDAEEPETPLLTNPEDLKPQQNTAEEPEPVYVYPSEDDYLPEKKRRKWLWLLILAPVAVAGIYFLFSKTKTNKTENSFQESSVVVVPSRESQIIDSVDVTTQNDSASLINTGSQITKITLSDSLRFVLVGGSFKDEENAEKYLQQLKEAGLEPFHLGKRGNFFIIGVGRYNSEKEALTASREYSEKNPESAFWIMEDK